MVFRSTYLIPTTVSTVERTGGILVPATLNSLARVNPAAMVSVRRRQDLQKTLAPS